MNMKKKLDLMVIFMSRTNEQGTQNGMRRVNVNVDLMAVFVIINDVGMKINVGMNVNN